MEIIERKFCVLSTAHISSQTNDWLRAQSVIAAERHMAADPMPEAWVQATPYGYIMHVGEEGDANEDEKLPEDLRKVVAYVRINAKGAEWLDLDCDGDETDDLPTFEW